MLSYDEFVNYAFKRNGELPADIFEEPVSIEHLDGSIFNYKSACIEFIDKYLIVYSEHHHPNVFFKEDLKSWTGSDIGTPQIMKDSVLIERIETYASENIFENQEPDVFENSKTKELWERAKDAYFTLKSYLTDATQEGTPNETPKS
jgi:hypothetical protein